VLSARDLGYLVTLITDTCTIYMKECHDFILCAIKGY
jgi:nicotinamidase-related amidase